MTPETLFQTFNTTMVALWLFLLVAFFFSRMRGPIRIVGWFVLPIFLGGAYAGLLFASLPLEGGFGSLAEIRAAFGSDSALLAGWVHYLVFDYFVGTWVALDAIEQGIPKIAVVPVLLFCFLAGPLGLLGYLLLRNTILAARRAR